MEWHNRRVLLLNEDLPISPLPPSSSSSSLQLPPRPIFISNLAYAFLVLFTALFLFAFFFLYIRQFSCHSSPRRRDSSAAKKPLPAVPYRRAAEDSQHEQQQQAECAICLDEFVEGETVKVIPYCRHVFHPACIDTWLEAHVTCPVCRCTKMGSEVGRGVMENNGNSNGEEGEVDERRVGLGWVEEITEFLMHVRDSASPHV